MEGGVVLSMRPSPATEDVMTADIEQAYGWSSQHESDSNRLKGISQYKLTLSPAAADIWFKVAVESVTAGTEVRGRIVGPRCLFAEAAEAVSPLRSVRHKEEGSVGLIARTAIPNPAFWCPDNPFLYRVVVELWQDGQRCDVSGFDLGFRAIEMGAGRVLVNHKPLSLQGMSCLPPSREEAVARRQAGYNLVLAGKEQWHWWVRASPMGFLLLERVALSTLTPQYIDLLSGQPCFLGFVLEKELLNHSLTETEPFLRYWQDRRVFIGLELNEPTPLPLPKGLSFLVCPESRLEVLSSTSLPKFVLREKAGSGALPPWAAGGVLGWIDQETRPAAPSV
jgi:hypothetical protein